MSDAIKIRLQNADKTRSCGGSLAHTLYDPHVTILLNGELGAGKTTFLQGFAEALGVSGHITSPTFALEQRYNTKEYGELLHVDLYRLSPTQAATLIAQTDEHPGIRCIEWAERLAVLPHGPTIHIALRDAPEDSREVEMHFEDLAIPTHDDVLRWRQEVHLPENVAAHCNAVSDLCDTFASAFLERAQIVRPLALRRAAELHDLLRFIDFHPGSAHLNTHITHDDHAHWARVAAPFAGMSHEEACAAFLTQKGFPGLGDIVRPHGLKGTVPITVEQQLLFYADKRVMNDQVVSLQERFADFNTRYTRGEESVEARTWKEECIALEAQLFPEGPPR